LGYALAGAAVSVAPHPIGVVTGSGMMRFRLAVGALGLLALVHTDRGRAQSPLSALNVPDPQIVLLLPAEAAARSAWVPEHARLSPWFERPAPLYAAPRRDSPQVGTMPAGRLLPPRLWFEGAYEIGQKLDGGAWFLARANGKVIGYVEGKDVTEIWPLPAATGLGGGKVLREWTAAGGERGLVRDTGKAFEVESAATCQMDQCDTAVVYTPAPPTPGAIVPSFQAAPLVGSWSRGDMVRLRVQVPRAVVETPDTVLLVCVGHDTDCTQQQILPPPKP
jgi:hypothetical protein